MRETTAPSMVLRCRRRSTPICSGAVSYTHLDVYKRHGYVLEEVDTPIRYVVPDSQTATIEWNEVTHKSVNNILKKFRVAVTKSDRETGTAQGDGSLAGAVYGLYKGDTLIDLSLIHI